MLVCFGGVVVPMWHKAKAPEQRLCDGNRSSRARQLTCRLQRTSQGSQPFLELFYYDFFEAFLGGIFGNKKYKFCIHFAAFSLCKCHKKSKQKPSLALSASTNPSLLIPRFFSVRGILLPPKLASMALDMLLTETFKNRQ
jgi:hypothetical protein